MSNTFKTTAAAAALAVAGVANAGDTAENTVNQGIQRWDAAFNAADASALAALYAPDAMLVPPTGITVKGTADIRSFWEGLFKVGFKSHKIGLTSVRQEGKLIIVVGKWQAVGPDDKGADKQYGGQLVNILETQDDGQARSILHTWN